jgi:hypothetical protein
MKKKQLKFKIYQHECVDCGWKIWRDYIVENPRCSQCESTNLPKISEDELVKEIVMLDTNPKEEYEQAKRIVQEIVDGKSLEEIDGLELDFNSSKETIWLHMTDHLIFVSSLAKKSRMISNCFCSAIGIQGGALDPLADNSKDNYY